MVTGTNINNDMKVTWKRNKEKLKNDLYEINEAVEEGYYVHSTTKAIYSDLTFNSLCEHLPYYTGYYTCEVESPGISDIVMSKVFAFNPKGIN